MEASSNEPRAGATGGASAEPDPAYSGQGGVDGGSEPEVDAPEAGGALGGGAGGEEAQAGRVAAGSGGADPAAAGASGDAGHGPEPFPDLPPPACLSDPEPLPDDVDLECAGQTWYFENTREAAEYAFCETERGRCVLQLQDSEIEGLRLVIAADGMNAAFEMNSASWGHLPGGACSDEVGYRVPLAGILTNEGDCTFTGEGEGWSAVATRRLFTLTSTATCADPQAVRGGGSVLHGCGRSFETR
jgi:hypothetical protein